MGTLWDFQEPFCFYPWEPSTGLCTPQSPIENTEAVQRNVECQWSGCTSTFGGRETEVACVTWCLCAQPQLLWEARSENVLTLSRCPSPQTAKRPATLWPWPPINDAHFKAEFKKNCLNNFFFPKWCQKFAPSVFFFFFIAYCAIWNPFGPSCVISELPVCLKLLSPQCISERKGGNKQCLLSLMNYLPLLFK